VTGIRKRHGRSVELASAGYGDILAALEKSGTQG
jgi:hypothetical protein